MMANGRLKNIVLAAVTVLAVSGCAKDGAIDVSSGVGVSVTRSGCPPVAVPDYTGDITIFDPVNSTNASAIDVVANITNVRSTCNSEGARIYTEATFDVRAVRSNAAGARTVTVPYFSTVVQGGTAVVAKRVNNVTLQFADGAYRASASGKAGSYIDASAARLPEDVIERLTKRRKPGDPDAALDPLADPAVKAAVARSSFELLIGFQLTQAQLQYNATR
ncbi:hypothetical protein [uncultured Parasphingorhabdus sp.]|uniref:hypothetical protein n=1 Tax=uncultured Parasphingorhabdus sp. TaxID=2709694 RepID=UPI0030DD8724|tara:strand:+ start:43373 stop:44032 length:660 start_codon:yes stop_codon:yes gene_type:complete